MPDEPTVIRRVLVATDFSPRAAIALSKAIATAAACQAEVTIASVLTDVRGAMAAMNDSARQELFTGDIAKFQQALCKKTDAKLAELVATVPAGPVPIQRRTLVGTPFVEIIHAVQEQHYDIVFVGTRGHNALQRFVLGSTTERLIRHCPTAVWSVQGESAGPAKRILAATDFSQTSDRTVEAAARLAQRLGAELHLLHVVEMQELDAAAGVADETLEVSKRRINRGVRHRLDEAAQSITPPLPPERLRIAWGEPWKVISDTARRLEADLVVLGAVGRSGIPGLLLGNTAEKLLHTVRCDVLTVKPAGFVSTIQPAIHITSSAVP
jgi:nucleotide-binding universal stress UspA family protein